MMLRNGILVLILTLTSSHALLSETRCSEPQPNQTLSEYLQSYSDCLEAYEEATSQGELTVEGSAQATADKQAASPSSPTPGFASQLRGSIEDYLSLFSFAIDGVTASDDDQSLTVRFNPVRSGSVGSLGLSVTATQPKAADLILKEVPEAQKAAAREALESGLDETDDLTFKASFSFERNATKHDHWLLGRSHENYRSLIETDIIPVLASPTFSSEETSRTVSECDTDASRILGLSGDEQIDAQPMGKIQTALGDSYDTCLRAWQQEEAGVVEADKKLNTLAWLPFLIDNQPQLFLTLEVNDRAEEVGRSGWSVKLSYEMGLNNLNTLLRRAAGKTGDEWRRAFYDTVGNLDAKEIEAENKFTFSLIYAERNPYSYPQMIGTGDDAITLGLDDLPRATEVCGKLEWHRNATWHKIEINNQKVYPKLHASLEYVDVSDDPKRRDRLVGTLTYEIPMPSGVAMPISLSYANHSQFLGEVDKELSAHFGLSYKLPKK